MNLSWETFQNLTDQQAERVAKVLNYCRTLPPSRARAMFRERLIKQIASDTAPSCIDAWPLPVLDNWIARSTPAAYEVPELIAQRRAQVHRKNSLALRARRFRDAHFEGVFWTAVALVVLALGGLYLIAENLGWFRL